MVAIGWNPSSRTQLILFGAQLRNRTAQRHVLVSRCFDFSNHRADELIDLHSCNGHCATLSLLKGQRPLCNKPEQGTRLFRKFVR